MRNEIAEDRTEQALLWGQAFPAQFLERLLRLLQTTQAHALQDLWRFGELYLRVVDDLPVVAPRVEEVEAPARKYLNPHLPQGATDDPPVVDHHPDMPVIVWGAALAFRERDELVPRVYKSHPRSAAPQLYLEEAPVELQRLLDVPDLESDVVEPDEPRPACHGPIIYAPATSRHPRGSEGSLNPVPAGPSSSRLPGSIGPQLRDFPLFFAASAHAAPRR